ncbi:MAG: hypothetical protein SCAL_000834 [Candidatus Syntrophoarchaeum caldarius]|uniref:DNA replication complex GINS family protein n=1 Tax=Candidatus Syntropharchaeum caldarium TaxID=1838285 RepID=A0A1F2PAX6_9EURY|nr:MAG: hypothetical protein SCAL_000834 [Candidatus Syntrophoarchaeum caldarius]
MKLDLGKLWRLVDDERSSSSLQKLPSSIFEEIERYINELQEEMRDLEGKRRAYLEDELKTARIKAEELFERRIFKVVGLAASRLSQMPANLLVHEEDLYKDLVNQIEALRSRILGGVIGEKSGKKEDVAEPESSAKKRFIRGNDTILDSSSIMRVLKDIPVFMGVHNGKSREYSLKKEDIVVLPRFHAEGLCKKKAAIEIDISKGEYHEDAKEN